MIRRASLLFLVTISLVGSSNAVMLFDRGASWRWRPGATEASGPVGAWREVNFVDSEFTAAPSPFWYDTTGDSSTLSGGTVITGMQGNYECIFLRKTFVISNITDIGGLRLGTLVDDGYVAWINGEEVHRVNVPGGAGSPVTLDTLGANAVEPVAFLTYDLPPPASYLQEGTNIIAVQVFQSSTNSSDLGFDASLEAILTETVPPTIADVTPARGGTVTNLTQITVTFSEPVSGVSAADLLINGVGTTLASPVSSSTYTFTFSQPVYGTVQIAWAAGHGIADQALPPNPFAGSGPGETWQYNLVDNTAPQVASLTPSAGATVRTLTSITVLFSEGVQGVNAADLLINNTAAAAHTQITPSQYTFTFPEPPTGIVQVAWAAGHGIQDLAPSPNPFAGGSWAYRFDPNAADLPPYISEFMASNQRALADENGDFSDWIEIYNPSAVTVNLEGWVLRDDDNQWRFPATNLGGGGFLVVFASEKNRAIPGNRLHTNFRLSAGGEYLGLERPDGSIASEFDEYPGQVPDVSYGYTHLGDGPLYTAGTNGVYFTRPTPGAANIGGTNAPGPAILNVRHTPNVPLDNDDLIVTAQVFPSFFTVASVSMIYRIMFTNEVTVPMFDDGGHGDGEPNDGTYGATIPANASTNGQMVRYYISATDVNSRASRWPTYLTTTNHEQYLGTVVNPSYVTSSLPIIHLFVHPSEMARVDSPPPPRGIGPGRASVFYDGEFYDNMAVQARGNTTINYPKKSHRFEFNRENPFRHPGVGYGWPEKDGPRIRRTSFVADFPDPTYMRQGMSFWLCDQIGSPGSFYYPVRLQLNGQFYQLANHNDVHTEEMLDRLGYDPNGALYNAAGQVVPNGSSTGGFEKKTREWDGTDWNSPDYSVLSRAVAETVPLATRRTNIFEMLDLPNVINYLVAARFVQENDDVWANMSLYHDNDGDDLWRIIGFDMNLSWGAFYFDNAANDTGIQAVNDNHKSFPLYGSSQALSLTSGNYNRIYDVIFDVPQTLEMFQRRMRTMLDAYVLPPGTPIGASSIEQKIFAWRDLIMTDAALDRGRWQWPAVGGQNNLPPGTNVFFGVKDLLEKFFYLRRQHFYGKHSVTNTALAIGTSKTQNAGFPLPQPANAYVTVLGVEVNPASGNQQQEYIHMTNPAPFAVEISGWKLEGAVDFTFAPGTVIPSRSAFYVSPNVRAFRSRTTGPRGGQGHFVLGPYNGQLSARGETIRVRNGAGNVINTFTFPPAPTLAQQFLRITEIMYHPPPVFGDLHLPDEFEYVELKNISTTTTLSLNGVRFTNGIFFNFTGSAVTSLAPGARVLIVKNAAAFAQRYAGGLPIAGQYTGSLDNGGERLRLIDFSGEEVLDFDYEDDWYPITDGLGFSLVVVNENAEPDLWDSKTNWRASALRNGSPGNNDPAPTAFAPVLITEALSRTDVPPPTDSIELHNPTNQPANIGGWWLSDDFNTPQKYRLTNGTVIPAGGYIVLNESQFNTIGGFALSSDGDEVWLFSGDEAGNLTGYSHGHRFGAAEDGVSFGRYVTSVGEEHFVAQTFRTLGTPNSAPRVGPVVINEIMYRPPDLDGAVDNELDEYVELLNVSDSSVQLYDPAISTNTWRIKGGIDFDFPATNVTLAAGEYVLLVSFNPTNSATLGAFRAKYGVASTVRVFGPYDGKLANNGEDVELKKPTTPLAENVPYVLIDEVSYSDSAPWPAAADGYGLSLQRRVAAQYGNDPINWTAAPTTAAGATATGETAPVITLHPQGRTVVAGSNVLLSVSASGSGLRFQWRLNGVNILNGTNSLLQLLNVQGEQAGEYNVAVFNSAGSVVSSNAFLSVLLPASILQQPSNVNTNPGANVTFRVIAYSPSPLAYQWRKDGTNLINQTSDTLVLNNVGPDDGGIYTVEITDEIGAAVSEPALLRILIQPLILQAPVSQAIIPGSTVTFSVTVTNTATLPIGYRWRTNRTLTPVLTLNSRTTFLTLANVRALTNISVVATNIAQPGGRLSTEAIITYVTDFDEDGTPDWWEQAYGFATNNLGDAGLDFDNDKMSNRAEYIAGTDPTNALSYLKVEPLAGSPTGATIQFFAVSNRTYTVEYTDLVDAVPWQQLAHVVARATNHLATVPDPQATPKRFYRLVTPRQE